MCFQLNGAICSPGFCFEHLHQFAFSVLTCTQWMLCCQKIFKCLQHYTAGRRMLASNAAARSNWNDTILARTWVR